MFFIHSCLKSLNKVLEIKSRPLTEGEKNLAQSVFGESLQLTNIQIVAHRAILKDYAMSPNGHIYFNIQNWSDDFSACSLAKQSWLIHELTHVWQIQQGLAVLRNALFNRKYSYVLEQGKLFLSYGIEQQAQMVQDYFIRRELGQDCQAYVACIPFLLSSAPSDL